jgi:hypothetical protein
MDGFINDFFETFFGSTGLSSIQQVIDRIARSPWPDLKAEPFQNFYAINFGFAVITSLVAMFVSFISAVRSGDRAISLNGVFDLVKTFLVGYFLVPILYLLSWFSNQIGNFLTTIPNLVIDGAWSTPLTAIVNLLDPGGGVLVKLVGDAFTSLLGAEADLLGLSLYFYAFLFVVSYSLYRFNIGHLPYRIAFAGLATILTFQPVVLFILVIGAVGLKLIAPPDSVAVLGLVLVLIFAALLPIFIFFRVFSETQKVQIEGPVFSNSSATDQGLMSSALGSYSFGRADNRTYRGYVPEAGERWDKVGNASEWVGKRANLAAAALSATGAGAPVAGIVAGAGKVASVASQGSRYAGSRQRQKAYRKSRTN